MAISTNQKPTIYRNLYENTGPAQRLLCISSIAQTIINQKEVAHIKNKITIRTIFFCPVGPITELCFTMLYRTRDQTTFNNTF